MRSKKCFIVGVSLAACLFGLHTTLWGQEPNDVNYIEKLKDPNEEIRMLQEKIKQLENVVETQQNTISQLNQELDEQTKKNERLKNLCSQAGIDISPVKDIKPSEVRSFSKVFLNQLYYFYNAPMTDAEKEERYKEKYKGKWVQWTGKVKSIMENHHYYVVFIYDHPVKDKANDRDKRVVKVTVAFDKMLKERILSFKEGSIVTYQGKLPDSYVSLASLYAEIDPLHINGWISGAGELLLTDGRIVSP